MIYYVEIVFISNFLIDLFIFVFCVAVLKKKYNFFRLIFASVVGGIASCAYPLTGKYAILIKIFCALVLPAIYCKNCRWKEYLTSFAVFIAVSMGLAGIVVAINYAFFYGLGTEELTYGKIPIVFSTAGLVLILIYSFVKKNFAKVVGKNSFIYDVVIANENCTCKTKAYYDSGNRVYTNYGERVVLLNDKLYNMLMPAVEEEVFIHTPTGLSRIEVTDATVLIYLDDGDNKYITSKQAKVRD